MRPWGRGVAEQCPVNCAPGKPLEKSVWGSADSPRSERGGRIFPRKVSQEKCLGQGAGRDICKTVLGISLGGRDSGRASGKRLGTYFKTSSQKKCIGKVFGGRISGKILGEGHRENRFGSVFRKDCQKNVLKKVPCLPALNPLEKFSGRMGRAAPCKGNFPG